YLEKIKNGWADVDVIIATPDTMADLGKLNFDTDKLVENTKAFLNTIIKLKPPTAKGQYVKSLYLSSTMGPGLKISKEEIAI
ncbi:MAG: 50S ribosomal protein L1, partial [Ignavibacterium sp.]|nr:50S ribosomal protein L1 [Ignavibacterium sp.]